MNLFIPLTLELDQQFKSNLVLSSNFQVKLVGLLVFSLSLLLMKQQLNEVQGILLWIIVVCYHEIFNTS